MDNINCPMSIGSWFEMSVEAEADDHTDPAASPLLHFGAEVRLERERLGISRHELADKAACSYSLVAKIECGDRVPPREFAEACDRLFPHSGGRFVRLWPLAVRYAFPPWFRAYVELETKATAVRFFSLSLLPGLVQTEDYARAVLRTGRPANLDDLVTARMARQRILTREQPARLWLVVSATALRTEVGGPGVMRGQLKRLRELAEVPTNRVQILDDKEHHGFHSPFGLLSFADGASDVVHVDGYPRGYLLAEQADVARARDAYDLLTAMACSPHKSPGLIDSIMRDL
ncbi:helix-turn-helix domain-containing protein [Streptomyces fradiae]|uniref:helix-turn-helix domain-containing protein n=1 Tax=Streptomyces fradiae TaxID=1906 RepID=UPI00201A171B|nr:helix-turn-helix transcriptional regulator [Streptomyces fradiae]